MNKYQGQSFMIQVKEDHQVRYQYHRHHQVKVNLSPMSLFQRFRKILMRLVFSLPSRSPPSASARHRPARDRLDPPKTSCSSYHYSPNSHYSEAIADCIEFFNKSSQQQQTTPPEALV
ncbi:hypothetical protein ACLOJK_027943 [Asimina triloba]